MDKFKLGSLTLIVVLSFFACKSNTEYLSSASYNNWYGGQQGVSGMNYYFYINNGKTTIIDSIIIDNKCYRNLNPILKSDSLIVSIKVNNPRNVDGEANDDKNLSSPKKAKIFLKNKNKKSQVLELNSFKKKKTELYE